MPRHGLLEILGASGSSRRAPRAASSVDVPTRSRWGTSDRVRETESDHVQVHPSARRHEADGIVDIRGPRRGRTDTEPPLPSEHLRHEGPWKGLDEVEVATLEWIDWFNNVRLLEPIGYVPPAEFEEAYYAHAAVSEEEERLEQESLH